MLSGYLCMHIPVHAKLKFRPGFQCASTCQFLSVDRFSAPVDQCMKVKWLFSCSLCMLLAKTSLLSLSFNQHYVWIV